METYNFPSHRKNDTFDGVIFTVSVNGSPLDLTNATILASFRKGYDPVKTLSNPADITITNAAGGIFQIDPLIITWDSGSYTYSIQITLANGSVKTYIGGTWTITDDF